MNIFSSCKIGDVELSNHLVRSATWEGLATEKGEVTDNLVSYIDTLAKGGIGLIITSHAYIERSGQASPLQLGICDDSNITGLKRLTEAAHKSKVKIFAQLNHGGCHALPELTKMPSFGVSMINTSRGGQALAMGSTGVKNKIMMFANSADRAIQAGFDGVQIHCAHGYLISQFLSPFYNKRNDEWGGSLENRMRFLLETILAIRIRIGNHPIIIKLNVSDFIEGGIEPEQMLEIVKSLENSGIEAIELSGGTVHPDGKYNSTRTFDPSCPEEEGYYIEAAKKYKEISKIPLILVGGFRSYERISQILSDGIADFVSMSRPLICEPNLPKRWKASRANNKRRAKCISCNGCRPTAVSGKGLRCIVYG
ncbi:MAG: NADH:flavin oxidoreductase [Synergistaceae bacterium]|nr:NADH:flavin oxidoreductase [Synergistaceae bacterium]